MKIFTLKFFKLIYIGFVVLIFSLQSTVTLGFGMSDQELDQAIRKYLSIYNNYQIDENVVNDLTRLIRGRNYSYIFNYLAAIKTDDEFLPYLEKYSDLKLKFTGRSIDPDVKVTFITNNYPYYDESIRTHAVCDRFTRIIFVDPHFWQSQEGYERTRERVLFHELGHCDLYRNESSTKDISFMRVRNLERLLASNHNPMDLDHIFETLYEELFSEQNTLHIRCYNTEVDANGLEKKIISDECIITQNRAFQDLEYNIPTFYFQLIGSSSLRNYRHYL